MSLIIMQKKQYGRQYAALRYISVYLLKIRDCTVAKDPDAVLLLKGGDSGAEYEGQAECWKFGEKPIIAFFAMDLGSATRREWWIPGSDRKILEGRGHYTAEGESSAVGLAMRALTCNVWYSAGLEYRLGELVHENECVGNSAGMVCFGRCQPGLVVGVEIS